MKTCCCGCNVRSGAIAAAFYSLVSIVTASAQRAGYVTRVARMER